MWHAILADSKRIWSRKGSNQKIIWGKIKISVNWAGFQEGTLVEITRIATSSDLITVITISITKST